MWMASTTLVLWGKHKSFTDSRKESINLKAAHSICLVKTIMNEYFKRYLNNDNPQRRQ